MWMNEHEVNTAARRITEDECAPHLVEAAKFLEGFCDLINSISDGWAYWSYGTRCSDDLQTLVNDAQWPAKRETVTPAAVKAACEKVRRFLRQCSQTQGKPEVVTFLDRDFKHPPVPPVRQPEAFKSFRVVSASTNTNPFGLRGYVLVARDGEAWQVGRSDSANDCVAPRFEKGKDVTFRMGSDGPEFPSCEIPEKLPDCPPAALVEIFNAKAA